MIVGVHRTPELMPCRVLDATGKRIDKLIEADTETGECLVFLTDAKGLIVTRFCEATQTLLPVKVRRTYPAPLRLEPLPRPRTLAP